MSAIYSLETTNTGAPFLYCHACKRLTYRVVLRAGDPLPQNIHKCNMKEQTDD